MPENTTSYSAPRPPLTALNGERIMQRPEGALFIAFEGLDGSGQSTQTALLNEFLTQKGHKVVITKEPTLDSEAGKKIREILDEKTKIEPRALQELFAKDREAHLQNKIIPALKDGKVVISDRYFFSSFAFGASEGVDLEWLILINSRFLIPDQTFILRVRPEVCIRRIEKRGTAKTLFEKQEKLTKVWNTYAVLPHRFSNAALIEGERPIEEIHDEIKKIITRKFFKG